MTRSFTKPRVSSCRTSSGSRPPCCNCWRNYHAISLRLMVRARCRRTGSSGGAGSSLSAMTSRFGSLMLEPLLLRFLLARGDLRDRLLEVLDELLRLAPRLVQQLLQLLASLRLQLLALGQALLQRGQKLVDAALDAVELAAEVDEAAPDLLQRQALVHQRLDEVDAAHRAGRVEAVAAAVLSFLAHPA